MAVGKKMTIDDLMKKKAAGIPITRTVLYDAPTASFAEEAGIDVILCGDSFANVVLGYNSTLPCKFDVLLEHTKAVRRGAPNTFLIADMPYMSYQPSTEEAIRNAGRFMAEADADCVKIEGGIEVVPVIKAVVNAGIPVWGHTGLTPQSVKMLGGYKSQGRGADIAYKLIQSVDAIVDAGAFALTVEAIPYELGRILYERANDYLIFCTGSGKYSDGPVNNLYDMLGFFDKVPKFARRYANFHETIVNILKAYIDDCESFSYPSEENCYYMKDGEEEKLLKMLKECK